jgi:hypothetical protein
MTHLEKEQYRVKEMNEIKQISDSTTIANMNNNLDQEV